MKTCPKFRPILHFSTIALAVAFSSSVFAEVSPIPVARDNSDLKSDPAVTRGVLENGMRYAIMPNPEPPNRVSLRLYVDAGSLMEEDDQQGLAHFLEHMAFNGTENFPAGEMVEYFQRLGMGFGNHTNAHTSFNETVYKLEMPNTETATLDEGFRLLKDYADGMLLLKAEIEAERGIILSEKRNRDSADWRTFLEEFEASLPDALVSRRLPIGTEEVIKTAPTERFEAFYEKWYTPDRMAVIVVGDIEVAAIEEQIKKHLSDIEAPAADIPDPDMGSVSKRGLTSHFHSEMEAGEVSISIDAQRPHLTKEPVDNSQGRAYRLRMGLASQIINRRLGIISKADESVINSGRVYYDDLYDLHITRYATISATCKPENWEGAVTLIEQELRRAVEHGFTDAELAEAKANVSSAYERAAQAMATRKSADLANEIGSRIGSRDVFTSPKDDLERVSAELEKVTAEQCKQAWAEFWVDAPDVMVLVSGNLKLDGAEEKIVAAYNESYKIAVEPPVEEADVAFAYAEVPEGGKVVERSEVEDLELTHATLNNGIKVNLRPTEFEDDTIYVRVRFGAGKLTQPKDKPGLAMFASNTFSAGGLEAHDVEALDRLFAGKATTVGFSVDEDSFVLDGKTRASDVRDQLLQLRAYLIAPGYRTEAGTQLRRFLDQYYQNMKTTPDGVFDDIVERLIHSDDHRFGVPPQDKLNARTMDEVKAWMSEQLADSYMEISVVGDFDREEMLKQVTEVFGSLPERETEKPDYADLRKLSFPEGGIEKRYEFESQIPKAGVRVYWASEDIWNVQRTRRLSLLGAVFDDRLRVKLREELGDTYSPIAHNAPSEAYTGYGYFFAGDVVEPSQAEKVAGVIRGISDDLAGGNITEDELERALKPRLTSIGEYRRTNRYWLSSVTDGSQAHPERLDWARTFVEDHKNMKLSELQQLAKKYLGSDKAISVIAAPKAPNPAAKKAE